MDIPLDYGFFQSELVFNVASTWKLLGRNLTIPRITRSERSLLKITNRMVIEALEEDQRKKRITTIFNREIKKEGELFLTHLGLYRALIHKSSYEEHIKEFANWLNRNINEMQHASLITKYRRKSKPKIQLSPFIYPL